MPKQAPKRRLAVPVAALVTASLFMAWLWAVAEPHYALGDDFYLARAFAGEVGGVPETYNLYIHTLFAYLLNALTRLWGGVWWFSWLQCALLWLGSLGVLLGLMRTAERLRRPPWLGWLCGAGFLIAFAAEYCVAITFTTTAATLGAGAVCLLAGVDLHAAPRRVMGGVLGSACLLFCAYMLRDMAALPAGAFWCGLLVCRALGNAAAPKEERFAAKPAARAALAALAVLLCLVGVRAADHALTPERDYAEFLNATVNPIDYGGLAHIRPETMAENGWTEKELALIRSWYFLDENMSAESFRRVERDALAAMRPTLRQRLQTAKASLGALFRKAPAAPLMLLACGLLCAAAAFAALVRRRGKARLWGVLAPVGCVLALSALLLYLGVRGRLPMRAAATALLPACAMAVALAMEELCPARHAPGTSWLRARRAGGNALAPRAALRALPAWGAIACAVLCALQAASAAFAYYYHPDHGDPNQCVYASVDRYALASQDVLLIGDRTLGVDQRLFPDRSAGVPTNLLPMWGGWNNHSQGYRAAFARYGFAHDRFTIAAFLGDGVRLVTGAQGPSEAFMEYLGEQAGGEVIPIVVHRGDGFAVYRFEEAEQAGGRAVGRNIPFISFIKERGT